MDKAKEEEYKALRRQADAIIASHDYKGNFMTYPPEEREVFLKMAHIGTGSPESKEKARKTRMKNKNLRDLTRYMLEAELADEEEIKQELEERGFEASEQGAILLSILRRAKTGDVEAFKVLRDTSGQKPVDGVQLGNLDETPIGINLSNMSTEQLMAMIAKRTEEE